MEPASGLEQDSNEWDTRQLVPTDHHYLLYPQEDGFGYAIADALVVCSRIGGSGVVYKSFGVNLAAMGAGGGWTHGQCRNSILADRLDIQKLERMVSYLMKNSLYTREEALREIRSDFLYTWVRMSPEVQRILSDTD